VTDRAYLRISLDRLTSGSIDKQRGALQKRADADAVFYEDRSTSGSVPFAERAGGRRLLDDLQPGDRVLVTKIDRAARDVLDLLNLVKRVKATGATIVFTEQADVVTEGPMGDLLLTLLGAVAQFERALIAERRRESLASFREQGRHAVGRAPFGLVSVPNPAGRGLVLRPHPEESGVLRDVVERLLAGQSQASLAEVVGMGAPAFSRLLRNDRLAGVLERTPEGPRLDPDQAIFSLAEWSRLQDFLRRPEKAWSKTDGIGAALFCASCGDRLYLNKAANPAHTSYRCRKVKHGEGDGPAASVMAKNAEEHIGREFLARFGALPVLEEVTVDSSAERDEALALARLRLAAAQEALEVAQSDDDEEQAFQSVRDAKRSLRAAEGLPSTRTTVVRETGQSFAEVWEDADGDGRADLLLRAGRWVVEPGRLPIEEKVHLDEAQDYMSAADYGDGESRGPRVA
jgi:DNA invertase Pin-like site-specific DNA recombinase